jgi:hypothetical protein
VLAITLGLALGLALAPPRPASAASVLSPESAAGIAGQRPPSAANSSATGGPVSHIDHALGSGGWPPAQPRWWSLFTGL